MEMLKFKHFLDRNAKLQKADHQFISLQCFNRAIFKVLMVRGTIYGFTFESKAVLLYI